MFSLEAVTNAPVDIGGRVTIEAPFRVRLSMGFGAIPGAYVGLINDALATAGAYDGFVARSVDAAFNRGTSWRSQIGLRPFKNSGFYLDGGYAVITLQGRLSGSDVAAMAANFDVDTTGIDQGAYELETEVRMWAAEMGWQGQLNDGLVFGIGIGVLGTLSSKSLVRTSSEAGSSGPQGLATTAAVAFLDQQIETYGYLPTLTVRLGYDLL